jgi:hypothetical protein
LKIGHLLFNESGQDPAESRLEQHVSGNEADRNETTFKAARKWLKLPRFNAIENWQFVIKQAG